MATKLYLHSAASALGGTLPGAGSISATVPGVTAAAAAVNLAADTAIGVLQDSVASSSSASASIWQRRFLSPPLAAQTIVGSATYNGANKISNLAANSSDKAAFVLGVWRPSTGLLVGRLWDFAPNGWAAGLAETPGTETEALTPVVAVAGDVLVIELWEALTNTTGLARSVRTHWDGTIEGSAVSNAAFIAFSNPILMLSDLVGGIAPQGVAAAPLPGGGATSPVPSGSASRT